MNPNNETTKLDFLKNLFTQKFEINIGNNKIKLKYGVEAQDDCAIYNFGNIDVLIGSDFIRGNEFYLFQLGLLNYEDLGYYLIVANLSDIAAMGGIPIGITTNIRYHNDLSDVQFKAINNGIKLASNYYNVPIVGGDIGGYISNVLSATALGIHKKHKSLLRKNFKIGDKLFISGDLGLAYSAIIYFKKARDLGLQLSEKEEHILLNKWKKPIARIKLGNILSNSNLVNGCMDISDGLKSSLSQLSYINGNNYALNGNQIIINPIIQKIANFLKIDPLRLVFGPSVDFELLFSISDKNQTKFKNLCQQKKLKVYEIGNVIEHIGENILITSNEKTQIPGYEWKHDNTDILNI